MSESYKYCFICGAEVKLFSLKGIKLPNGDQIVVRVCSITTDTKPNPCFKRNVELVLKEAK